MDSNLQKRVIELNPFEVTDETLAALKEEINMQSDTDLNDIEIVDTIVLDSNEDGGLNSHATIFENRGDSR